MKKINYTVLCLIFAAFTVTNAYAAGSKAIALTLKVQGDVQLRKAGTKEVTALKFGTPLDNGDWIRTLGEAYAVLIFTDDKSQIKLRENTEVTIEGKRDENASIAKRISLEVGDLYAKIEKQSGSMQVATPTSVASVKGTEFWVVVLEDGTSFVVTLEGLVEMVSRISGQIVEVRPGEQGECDLEGNADVRKTPPGAIPPDPEDDGNGNNGEGGGQGNQGGGNDDDDEGGGQGGFIPDGSQPGQIDIEIEDVDGRSRTITIYYQPQEDE